MAYLSLPDAKILEAQGWGWVVDKTATSGKYTVELADDNLFVVLTQGWTGQKRFLWIPPDRLWLTVATETVDSGGGYFGGGFGAQGAAEGMVAANILNALTTRHREYTLLVASTVDPDGKQAHVALGFRNMNQSVLEEKLTEAIPRWIEPFVGTASQALRDNRNSIDADEAARSSRVARGMRDRGLLTADQTDRLIQVLKEIAPPGSVPEEPHEPHEQEGDRISKLKTLAELRESGALTEAEFEAEKQRLISQ